MIKININILIFLVLLNEICKIFKCEDIFNMKGKPYDLILFTWQKLDILLFYNSKNHYIV